MSVQQGYYNRVRYTLHHRLLGSQIIEEPIGWKDDEKELARNNKYHGIFAKFSNSSKYYGNGYSFLKSVYDIDGINANVRLTKDIRHPRTDDWVREYSGMFDFSTYVEENRQISLKFNSDGLEEVLKSRESEQVEIERETDLDGNLLPPLQTKNIYLEGRKIFLSSKWESNSLSPVSLTVYSDAGNTRDSTGAFPLNLVLKSHEQAQSALVNSNGNENIGSAGMMFLNDFDRERTIRVIGKDVGMKFKVTENDWDWAHIKLSLVVYENGINYNVKERRTLFLADTNPNIPGIDFFLPWGHYPEHTFALDFDETFQVQGGESIALEILIKSDLRNYATNRARFYVNFSEFTGNITAQEDSYFKPTNAKTILAHELADRLVTILTGRQNAVYSEALGRTDIGYSKTEKDTGALTGLSHGMWIRGFDKMPISEENKYKPFKTSFKDFNESFFATFGLGLGIERQGNRDRVRIEHLSYFYNRNTTIKLPMQVKNVKRSISKEHFFSGLEIGYSKGGEYEEAFGLDEYNAKSNFISCITKVNNQKSLVSKYRADMYGAEFARRKPEELFDNEDTTYDQDIFLFDLKPINSSSYNQRMWQDDFEVEPTGVYSPETATNLRLSPANCLMRNSWYLHSGLQKYPEQFLRFGSSTGNSKLKTKQPNKPYLTENEDIQNNQLNRPRFVPEIIEFEHVVDFDIWQQLNGKTTILGKEIMNVYGCVEFINENGDIERGFLLNLKPNKKGNWKLLKAY